MKRLFASLVIISLLSTSVLTAVAADTTVVIYGDTSAGENQPGWMFNRDPNTSTPFEFTTDEASIGEGSLYVPPIGADASDKFIGEYFMNVPIADVESITYDFMIGSGGESSDAVHFYMSVYANFGVSDDFKFYDCRYAVIPTFNDGTNFTTVTFDPTESYLVAQRGDSPFACPASPADMDVSSPGSTLRVFSLNVGDTSANDVGLDGYLDKVVVSVDGDATTFDFEPPTSEQLLDDLQADTADLVDHRKTERTLLASLNRAERYMEIRPQFARISLFQYVLQVRLYEAFGLIDDAAADQLVEQAQELLASLD